MYMVYVLVRAVSVHSCRKCCAVSCAVDRMEEVWEYEHTRSGSKYF